MASYKVNFYFDLLRKTPKYESLFSLASRLNADQLTFSKFVPANLAQHCNISRISNGKLTIIAENGAVASKLKQNSPSLIFKLQESGWEITTIQIVVHARYSANRGEHLIENNYMNRRLKLSQTARDCLERLVVALPASELKNAIQRFLKKTSK